MRSSSRHLAPRDEIDDAAPQEPSRTRYTFHALFRLKWVTVSDPTVGAGGLGSNTVCSNSSPPERDGYPVTILLPASSLKLACPSEQPGRSRAERSTWRGGGREARQARQPSLRRGGRVASLSGDSQARGAEIACYTDCRTRPRIALEKLLGVTDGCHLGNLPSIHITAS